MASQGSQIDFDLNIYFVLTRKQQSEDDCSSNMWHAFNCCEEHNLAPIWIKEKNCDDLNPEKKDVFVMDEFEGPTFDKLTTSKCLIVGPRCLLSCFMTGEPIPAGTNPVFTTAMGGLVVCVSGFPAEVKAEVGRKIEYMGGVFTKQLLHSVTHLIAYQAYTPKYMRAVDYKIPIMTEQWVKAVWETSLKENVRATSSRFDKFKCPPFRNLIITSTNCSRDKRTEFKKLISLHGGSYSGSLDGEKVKILLAPENSVLSEKLKFALKNKIDCVRPEWIIDSIKKGHSLPCVDYLINPAKGCSTPESAHENVTMDFSCLSAIPDTRHNGIINETMMTTMSTTMQRSMLEPKGAAYVEVLVRLNAHEAKMAGPFLDGCNIYLTGFPPDHREKLNRILNVGSATRLDNISDAVTHVIVGDPSKAATDLKLMKSKGLSLHFLTINWLEESMKLKCTAAEEDFKYETNEDVLEQKKIEPPSPLSKKNLQLLQKPRRPPVPIFNIDKEVDSAREMEEPDLIQEYRKSNVTDAGDKSLQKFLQPHEPRTPEISENEFAKNSSNISSNATIKGNDDQRVSGIPDDTTVPLTQPSEANGQIFAGLTFVLSGFDDTEEVEIAGNIEAMGGRLVSNSFKGIPDFGVVPLFGAPLKHTVSEVVTDLFIEDCMEQEAVVEINYYHKPMSISTDAVPLVNLVIAMSNYTGKERTFLAHAAEGLGARSQDTFARRTYLNKNTYGCTHLVCPTPQGSKYNAAVKWKLPAVTADWLLECLAQERRVDETPYLVGETMAPEKSAEVQISTPKQVNPDSQMGPPSDANTRPILTPKRQFPPRQEPGLTPVQTPTNKRLSIGNNKTQSSPFHVSTPETPYGQSLKPNPDSSTRKRWLQWTEDIPDIRLHEPPIKRRMPSTPLSELKRQLSEKVKKPQYVENGAEAETHRQKNKSTETSKLVQDKVTISSPSSSNTAVQKVQSFGDENSPARTEEINLQLAQLDQILQASTHETRQSLSSESAKQVIYDSEPVDHLAKCAVKDSQPDTVGWEDPVHTAMRRKSTIPEEVEPDNVENQSSVQEDIEEVPKKPKFMLSGIKLQERSGYEQVIIALGGVVSTEASFDPTATHLLCLKPARNEKFLSSIAAGKWILHCLYLKHSEEKGVFLDEENYEWGNPKSRDVIPKPTTETENQIAAAAYRWRLKLLKNPGGAFHDMIALLIGLKEKCLQFEKLICAGGGTVVKARPPYNTSPKSKKITHCFIQVKQLDQPVDWAMMASKGILCFLPQYLNDHLTAEKPLNPKDCVLPEFRKYLSLLPR